MIVKVNTSILVLTPRYRKIDVAYVTSIFRFYALPLPCQQIIHEPASRCGVVIVVWEEQMTDVFVVDPRVGDGDDETLAIGSFGHDDVIVERPD